MLPQGERVLFHYNGHGVPRPTANGEVWVFNKSYTQYIPLSLYDLQARAVPRLGWLAGGRGWGRRRGRGDLQQPPVLESRAVVGCVQSVQAVVGHSTR